MPQIKFILRIVLVVALVISKVYSQEYIDERNFKLTEISKDKTYGYTMQNPIKIGANKNAQGAYLNALKCPDGDKMHIKDMKLNYDSIQGLYQIVLKYENKPDTTVLYLLSTELDNPKAPNGFNFKTKEDLPKPIRFPMDSIKKVTTCNSKLYTAPNYFLVNKFGTSMPNPDKVPEYEGGIDSLKKYFAQHPLKDENAKKIVFDVTIYLFVNCAGSAGNYYIISKPYGDIETYSNQVLEIVNNMPQNWLPALKNGKPVDCYQALTFTVKYGSLEEVSY